MLCVRHFKLKLLSDLAISSTGARFTHSFDFLEGLIEMFFAVSLIDTPVARFLLQPENISSFLFGEKEELRPGEPSTLGLVNYLLNP